MLSCHDVADYFLAKQDEDSGDTISNLKLQKLAYYAQGFHLALFDNIIFPEDIEAWTHGPVVPILYHKYKTFNSGSIPPVNDLNLSIFNEEEKLFLDDVYNVFGQFSGWTLRNMTHEESPWKKNEANAGIITPEDLKDYFKTRIS